MDTVNDAHAAGRDHRWLLDLPEEPVTVPGDAARLHQVLANLLANARTHTPPGTTVVTTLATTADGCALVTVADDGPGIPDGLQPDIFERFARGDTSRSRAAGSTGLGLAIVAAVVEAHGGQVERPQPTRARPRSWSRLPARRRASADRSRSLDGSGPQADRTADPWERPRPVRHRSPRCDTGLHHWPRQENPRHDRSPSARRRRRLRPSPS